jgi:vacuolar-type H+-ATPase subunit I/STV1
MPPVEKSPLVMSSLASCEEEALLEEDPAALEEEEVWLLEAAPLEDVEEAAEEADDLVDEADDAADEADDAPEDEAAELEEPLPGPEQAASTAANRRKTPLDFFIKYISLLIFYAF